MSSEHFRQKQKDQMTTKDNASQEHIITTGEWAGGVPWQFIASKDQESLPTLEDCTAAFCVVTYKEKLVIVEHKKRGWELPGGHIDLDEAVSKTVEREVREEVGASIQPPQYFGYKKVFPKERVPHRDKPGMFYPFPHSYVPYFYAEAIELFNIPLADDVIAVRTVSFQEAQLLFTAGQNHHAIVEYLLQKGAITLS